MFIAMMDQDNIDALAGEYVLGTLNGDERAQVEARRPHEPSLEAAIQAWQRRLGPMTSYVASVAPPARIKVKVAAEIAARQAAGRGQPIVPERLVEATTPTAEIIDLTRRLSRWRTVAIGAGALAAALSGVIAMRDTVRIAPPSKEPTTFVAVLQKDAQSPAFIMTVDSAARTFTVRAVAADKPIGKSHELWIVNERLGPPKSLGVVGHSQFSSGVQLAAYAAGDIEASTYAVTLEPEGGSATGLPTGPVVYAGKLVQTKP
jgi:anti-sigma-K factor RskA